MESQESDGKDSAGWRQYGGRVGSLGILLLYIENITKAPKQVVKVTF